MITKEMLKRCSNELKQAFCALPDDVQKAIKSNEKFVDFAHGVSGIYTRCGGSPLFNLGVAYRLSPDTPTEPEWEEREVTADEFKMYQVQIGYAEAPSYLFAAPCRVNFLGIVYLKDGIETLRTSVDAAFGTPVRVRFAKRDK